MSLLYQGLVGERGESVPGPMLSGCSSPCVSQSKVSRLASGHVSQVSHRIFAVGLAFWFPLPKDKLCDWEDIASRLSLGLIWNMLSEMRTRYQLRVQRDGRGDGFHHFLEYLLEVCVEDDEVPTRDCVVQTCRQESCTECQAFASVFDGQRYTDRVALANRSHMYERVDKGLFISFVQMTTKKK